MVPALTPFVRFILVLMILPLSASGAAAEPCDTRVAIPGQADLAALVADADCLRGQSSPAARDRAILLYGEAAARGDIRSTLALAGLLALRRGAEDVPRAIAAYEKILPSLAATGAAGAPLMSNIQAELGDLYRDARDDAKAAAAYEQALQAAEIAGRRVETDAPFLMRVEQNLGLVLERRALYALALQAYGRALDMAEKQDPRDPERMAALRSNIGVIHFGIGAYEDAARAFQAAIGAAETLPPGPPLASAHGNLGLSLSALDRHDAALHALRASLQLRRALFGAESVQAANSLNNLGIVQARGGHLDDARQSFAQALAILRQRHGERHPDLAQVMDSMAEAELDAGNAALAQQLSLASMAMWLDAPDDHRDDLRQSYERLAVILDRKAAKAGSVLFAKLGINAHQGIRRQNSDLHPDFRRTLAGRYGALYRNLSSALIADGAYTAAQHVLVMLKQREFADFTGASLIDPVVRSDTVAMTPQEQQQWQDLTRLAAGMDSTAFAAAASARLDGFETRRQALQAQQLALQQDPERNAPLAPGARDAAILRMVALDDALHIFLALPGQETRHIRVPVARSAMARAVHDAVDAVRTRSPEADASLEALHALAFAPVADHLRASQVRTLLIDASGFLRHVPFAALRAADGRYLIEDYDVAFLTPAVERQPAGNGIVSGKGIGFGVSRALSGFSALPGARTELENIFGTGDRPGVLTGRAFLDEAFDAAQLKAALQEQPEILHIASHFKLEPGNENNSFLLLGDGRGLTLNGLRSGDGFRFTGLKLLTLSACDTAVGGGSDGAEIESFAAMAQANGAQSVLASMWPVGDAASARLMTAFYGHLVSGQSKARALASAQRQMIAASREAGEEIRGAVDADEDTGPAEAPQSRATHPFYWAAFVMMGDWR